MNNGANSEVRFIAPKTNNNSTKMQPASKSKISELQTILSRMTLDFCCVSALPEFGVRWREISHAVRNSRLPMTSASVARVLCRHIAKTLPSEEVEDIVARLRLKLAAIQSRTWHVIELLESTTNESISMKIHALPQRVKQALKKNRKGAMRPQVQSVLLGDLMYISVQMVSDTKEGGVLFAATPPGQDVALVSSVGSSLLKAVVEGLGYEKYENANLYGRDIQSLLRIHNKNWNENADHLTDIPEYMPTPQITNSGIDYTNINYDNEYIENIMGPNPPLLTELSILTTEKFFDPSRLNKKINLKVQIKSDDISKSLKSWVLKGAISPTWKFFHLYHQIKANKVTYTKDDSD